MPFGQRRQICCEQIEITAGAGALDSLPPLILPLTLPDLPLILWCRSPRLMARAEFAGMARMAAKLVIDSGTAVNGVEVLQCLASAAAGGEIVADLAWTRLTRWRETLARIFENRDMLARLAEAESVRVGFGPGLETSACYLAAWMAGALESVGRSLEPRLTRQEESLALELAGGGLRVQLTRHGDRLVTVVNGQSGCAHLPRPTAYLLMREELAIARHDPVFEKTLARAARLAVSSMPEQL